MYMYIRMNVLHSFSLSLNIVLYMCISILQTFPVLLERTGDTVSYVHVHAWQIHTAWWGASLTCSKDCV